MKKYLSILFLIVFIVPSVAFASWWNPFSWKVFSFLHKKELAPQVQVEVQKTPEEKINELQKQLDELKKQQPSNTSSEATPPVKEVKNIVPKTNNSNSTNITKPIQITDVCLNIAGIQTTTPEGYSWSYGSICSLVNLIDYCPNINGIQSKIPDGMFIYGSSKECLTQNEINYIADKMAEEKNKEIASETKSTAPIYSEECINAQDELEKINNEVNSIADISKRADATILKVNPALDKLNIACSLNMPLRTVEIPKTTNCYVNYYSNNANITCYSN